MIYNILEYRMCLLRGQLPKLPTGRSARFTTSLPPLHCMKAMGFLQISRPTAPPSPRQSLVKRRGLSLKLFMGLSEDRVPQNFVVNPHFPHENSDSRHPSIFRQSLTKSKQVSEEHLLWGWMQEAPLSMPDGTQQDRGWLDAMEAFWLREPDSSRSRCCSRGSPHPGTARWAVHPIAFWKAWMADFQQLVRSQLSEDDRVQTGYSPKRAATNATNPIEYQIRVRIERWCCAMSKDYMP